MFCHNPNYPALGSLFIVDDDYDILFSLEHWFTKKGYAVSVFNHSNDLFAALRKSVPDMILLDINLHGEDGREICCRIKKDYNLNPPVILFSANPSALENYQDYSADGILHKPFDLQQILKLVNSFMPA